MPIETAPIHVDEQLIVHVPHGVAALSPGGALQLAERLVRVAIVKAIEEESATRGRAARPAASARVRKEGQ